MAEAIVLASGSPIRAELLRRSGVPFAVDVPRIDEVALRAALLAEGASPRDLADTLAEMKALRIAGRHPAALVIGCDQVLDCGGEVFGKAESAAEVHAQLLRLRGRTHRLLSAAVICRDGEPLWRHVGVARLTMRDFSLEWLDGYVARNWPGIGDTVGGYRIEDEGVRLFSRIEGDYFHVLGMPLLEILAYLGQRGTIPT